MDRRQACFLLGAVLCFVVFLGVFASEAEDAGRVEAFRGIYFGDAAEDVEDRVKEHPELSFRFQLDQRTFVFRDYFHDNQLYRLALYGVSQPEDYYDEVQYQIKLLADMVEDTYGEPDIEQPAVAAADLEAGQNEWMYRWKAPELTGAEGKEISVGVSSLKDRFQAVLEFVYHPLVPE